MVAFAALKWTGLRLSLCARLLNVTGLFTRHTDASTGWMTAVFPHVVPDMMRQRHLAAPAPLLLPQYGLAPAMSNHPADIPLPPTLTRPASSGELARPRTSGSSACAPRAPLSYSKTYASLGTWACFRRNDEF